MRYQGWDVLLFPQTSKIPVQEFKTSCHVIQDQEYLNTHNGMLLVPTVTSFVPALESGEPFRVSIHAWENPKPSRYIMDYSAHPELIIFEARVFIDGRLTSLHMFDRTGPWPQIIDTTIETNRDGDAKKLVFPKFHPELLTRNYWSPGDNFGRIKIIISEGFPRSSNSNPFERIKTVVAFSFQHAPLDILEQSSIAWPNINMWRQVPVVPYNVPQSTPSQRLDEGEIKESHSHSPRRRPIELGQQTPVQQRFHDFPMMSTQSLDWRKTSSHHSTDTSMPDYASYDISHDGNSRKSSDTQHDSCQDEDHANMQSAGAYEYVSAALQPSVPNISAPENILNDSHDAKLDLDFTIAADGTCSSFRIGTYAIDSPVLDQSSTATAQVSFETPGSNPSICQPNSAVRSRKENMIESHSPLKYDPGDDLFSQRRTTRTTILPGSNKRQRFATPIDYEVADDDVFDDRKCSPSVKNRKISQRAQIGEVEGVELSERRALSGIPHNIV